MKIILDIDTVMAVIRQSLKKHDVELYASVAIQCEIEKALKNINFAAND
jgi:hypothetical protein